MQDQLRGYEGLQTVLAQPGRVKQQERTVVKSLNLLRMLVDPRKERRCPRSEEHTSELQSQ